MIKYSGTYCKTYQDVINFLKTKNKNNFEVHNGCWTGLINKIENIYVLLRYTSLNGYCINSDIFFENETDIICDLYIS